MIHTRNSFGIVSVGILSIGALLSGVITFSGKDIASAEKNVSTVSIAEFTGLGEVFPACGSSSGGGVDCNLTVTPSVMDQGDNFTLTSSSNGAEYATWRRTPDYPNWSGAETQLLNYSGSSAEDLEPGIYTYEFRYYAGGVIAATCDASFEVRDPNPATPTANLQIREIGSSTWSKSLEVDAGDEVELTWTSSDALWCRGDVYFSTNTGTGFTRGGTQQVVSEPESGSRTYTLECFNSNDTAGPSITSTATIDVNNEKPNLTSGAITNLDELVTGQSIRFQGVVGNDGDIAAGAFVDRFRFSTQSATGPWTDISTVNKTSLAVGATSNDTSTGITFSNPSTVYIEYCVDSAGQIDELNEADNCNVTTFTVAASNAPSIASCAASPSSVAVGANTTWTANMTGGNGGPYTYQWNGTSVSGQTTSVNTLTRSYSTSGTKTMQVRVREGSGEWSTYTTCSTLTVLGTPTVNLQIREIGTSTWQNELTVDTGDQVELTWSSSNATRCLGTGFSTGSGNPANGTQQSITEPASGEQTYTITCYNGSSGSAPSGSNSVTLTVNAGEPTLEATPALVDSGDTSTLEYNTDGFEGCTITGPGGSVIAANVTGSGTQATDPIYGQTVYTLACPGGAEDTATIRVRPVFEEF